MKKRNLTPAVKYGYAAVSVLVILVGAALVIFPQSSIDLICTLFGISLLIFGLVKLFCYIFAGDMIAVRPDLGSGILLAVIGLIAVIRPEGFTKLLFGAAGFAVLADGLIKVQAGIDARRNHIPRWQFVIVSAALTSAAGIILIINPFRAASAVVVVMGIAIAASGITNLISAVCLIRTPPDEIDAEASVRDTEQGRIERK